MKKKIDIYFTEHYDYLIELAESAISNRGRPYDASELVNYAYERALEMCEYGDVADCVCNIILKDCYWNNSYINRELLLNQTPFENTQDISAKPIETEIDEISEKVMIEKWYSDKKALIELYKVKIKHNKPKLIVLEKMLKLKTRNSRTLGKHFGIHYLSAYHYIKEIQDELRAFEEEVNNYDNKNVNNR